MAYSQQHNEKCFNHNMRAEEERNAKGKCHTMILMKRAKLLQELAELDTLVSNAAKHFACAPIDCCNFLFYMYL